ncbi:amidohydrolase family protein [Marinivivus vitaminiproducens]|uniref:amidohydrolase family protein n=1 Tax=Marinivivus vitaminiproducens TaxID=3035935 RepID=UPI002798DEC0|nr:amidohydrolase family protein [Geminicoccaceae bacterium SCSIO 64248]
MSSIDVETLWLVGLAFPDGRCADLEIAGERIGRIGRAEPGAPCRDATGLLCMPSLIEGHVHLDKTFLGCSWQPHLEGGSVAERIRLEKVARARVDDPVVVRGARLAERAIAFGAGTMRSHADIDAEWGLANLEAEIALRERFADRLDIQIVAFPQSGILRSPGTDDLLEAALEAGADLVGGLDPAGIDEDPVQHLEIVFDVADTYGKGVDIHLHDAGALGCFELGLIAEMTRAIGLQGQVTVSHAYCLGQVDPATFGRTAEALAASGIAILTSAPSGAMPPVRALRQAGVTVFAGSDNIRDAWAPYGDGDILRRATLAAYQQGYRSDADMGYALDLITTESARALGLADYGVAPGRPADFVLVEAETVAEAVANPPARRVVFKHGRLVAGTL